MLTLAMGSRPDTTAWSYLATYAHRTPIVETFHYPDVLQVFYGLPDNTARKSIQ